MSERGSPTLRHRRLGRELRRLRERAGMIGDEVSTRLDWSTAKLSRIENAKTLPSAGDVESMLALYGVDPTVRRELLELRRGAAQKGWWEEYRASLPPDLLTLLTLEAEAVEARNWEPQVLPGLLQTRDYAQAIAAHLQPIMQVPHSKARDRIEARMMRQQTLLTDSSPLVFMAVFNESVLRREIGDAAVMEAQLLHLMEISELAHVEMRVLPQAVTAPITTGPFLHLKFPDFPDTVYLEEIFSARLVEDVDQVYAYERVFERLMDVALDEEASRQLIYKIITLWRQ